LIVAFGVVVSVVLVVSVTFKVLVSVLPAGVGGTVADAVCLCELYDIHDMDTKYNLYMSLKLRTNIISLYQRTFSASDSCPSACVFGEFCFKNTVGTRIPTKSIKINTPTPTPIHILDSL
jgi:hypothetical protein